MNNLEEAMAALVQVQPLYLDKTTSKGTDNEEEKLLRAIAEEAEKAIVCARGKCEGSHEFRKLRTLLSALRSMRGSI